ncbi:MAG: hypothetical protein ABJR05_14265 [Balneola sp.]
MLDVIRNIIVSGMILSLIFGITLMIQLQKAADNPTWDILKKRDELESAFSKEKAKKHKVSYYGIWIGNSMMFLGFLVLLILTLTK